MNLSRLSKTQMPLLFEEKNTCGNASTEVLLVRADEWSQSATLPPAALEFMCSAPCVVILLCLRECVQTQATVCLSNMFTMQQGFKKTINKVKKSKHPRWRQEDPLSETRPQLWKSPLFGGSQGYQSKWKTLNKYKHI